MSGTFLLKSLSDNIKEIDKNLCNLKKADANLSTYLINYVTKSEKEINDFEKQITEMKKRIHNIQNDKEEILSFCKEMKKRTKIEISKKNKEKEEKLISFLDVLALGEFDCRQDDNCVCYECKNKRIKEEMEE